MYYTKGEKQLLIYSLKLSIGTMYKEYGVMVTYKKSEIYVPHNLICKMLDGERLTWLEKTNNIIAEDLSDLILKEPLENIPLFINVFPEIATWRLRIGK